MQKNIVCPKCGLDQSVRLDSEQKGTECPGCGIVFAKFNPQRRAPVLSSSEEHSEHSESADILDTTDRWIYRTGKYVDELNRQGGRKTCRKSNICNPIHNLPVVVNHH